MSSPSNALKTSGILFLLKINTSGNNASPVWTTIASQTGSKLGFKNKVIDVTGADDAGWDAAIPGQGSWTMSLDFFIILSDAGLQAVNTAMKNRTPVYIELTRADGLAYVGNAVISAVDFDLAFDKGASGSISFQGDQALDVYPA